MVPTSIVNLLELGSNKKKNYRQTERGNIRKITI